MSAPQPAPPARPVPAASPHFECHYCQRRFNRKYHLKEHFCTHLDERPFQCGLCELAFKRSAHLKSHQLVHQTKGAPLRYQCLICKTRVARKSYLREHMRKHTGMRRHRCQLCPMTFVRPKQLRKHEQEHSAAETPTVDQNVAIDRPFRCPFCIRVFKLAAHLANHQKLHTDGRNLSD